MSRSSNFLNSLIASLAGCALVLLLCLTFYDTPDPTITAILRVLFGVTALKLLTNSLFNNDDDDRASPFVDALQNTASGWFYPLLLLSPTYAMNQQMSFGVVGASSAFVMFAGSYLVFRMQQHVSSSEIDARAIKSLLKDVHRKITAAHEAGDGAAVADLEQQLAALLAAQVATRDSPQFSFLAVVLTAPIVALASAYWFTMLIGAPLLDARCMSREVSWGLPTVCPADHHVFSEKFRLVSVPPALVQPLVRVDVLRFDAVCNAVEGARERMCVSDRALYVSSLGLLAAPVAWVGVLVAAVLGRMAGLSRSNVSVLELPLRFLQSLFEAPLVLLVGASLLRTVAGSALPPTLTHLFDIGIPLATVVRLRDDVLLPYVANLFDLTVPAMIAVMEQQACTVMHVINAVIF
jgi:hypothetical protein